MKIPRSVSITKDQLVNQIIHQGKARITGALTETYGHSMTSLQLLFLFTSLLAVCRAIQAVIRGMLQLRPVPGSRDNQLNQSQGAGVPKGSPVKGLTNQRVIFTQRIEYPPWRFKSFIINYFTGGVTKS